jgi:hypothetical protein
MKKSLTEPPMDFLSQDDPLGIEGILNAKSLEEAHLAVDTAFQKLKDSTNYEEFRLFQIQSEDIGKDKDPEYARKWVGELGKLRALEGVKNGSKLEMSVHTEDQEASKRLRKSLIFEYGAKTFTEFQLIDLIVTSYLRSLRCNLVYQSLLQRPNGDIPIKQENTNLLKEVGKQIEAANKQFVFCLTTLKELHRPPINVKINAQQAFVAQNQQFNKTT